MELVAIETVEGLEMQKKISEKLVCIIDVYKECKPSSFSSSSSVLLVSQVVNYSVRLLLLVRVWPKRGTLALIC